MRAVKASRRIANAQSKLNRLAAELLDEDDHDLHDSYMSTSLEPSLAKVCRNNKKSKSRNSVQSSASSTSSEISDWKFAVVSCGNNIYGQSDPEGDFCDMRTYFSPTSIIDQPTDKIFAGNNLSALISEDGRSYTWGIGCSNTQNKLPRRELSLRNIRFISCGLQHIACISNQCEVYTWGMDSSGCLGHGRAGNLTSPQKVEYFHHVPVINVSCGGYHTAFVGLEKSDTVYGDVYTCGQGKGGQLGLGEDIFETNIPTRIFSFHSLGYKVSRVSCGLHHTLVLAMNIHENVTFHHSNPTHHVFAFGFGEFGRLGIDDDLPHFSPIEVHFERGFNPVFIGAGESHSVACSAEACYSWGNNEMCQLGNGMSPHLLPFSGVPVRTAIPEHLTIVKLAVGSRHSGVVTKCGRVLMWGWGEEGQCGSGGETNSSLPRPCKLPRIRGAEVSPLDLALGMTHSLLLVRNKSYDPRKSDKLNTKAKVIADPSPPELIPSNQPSDPRFHAEPIFDIVMKECIYEELIEMIVTIVSEGVLEWWLCEEMSSIARDSITAIQAETAKPVVKQTSDLRNILQQRDSRYFEWLFIRSE